MNLLVVNGSEFVGLDLYVYLMTQNVRHVINNCIGVCLQELYFS